MVVVIVARASAFAPFAQAPVLPEWCQEGQVTPAHAVDYVIGEEAWTLGKCNKDNTRQ